MNHSTYFTTRSKSIDTNENGDRGELVKVTVMKHHHHPQQQKASPKKKVVKEKPMEPAYMAVKRQQQQIDKENKEKKDKDAKQKDAYCEHAHIQPVY